MATVGAVAPNSKKQRNQRQILAAVEGKSDAEIRRAGGRYEHSLASVLQPSVTVPSYGQKPAEPGQAYGTRTVVHEEGSGLAPDTKYCRMPRIKGEFGSVNLHRVPLGSDNRTPLECWTCGKQHPEGGRGFRFQTTSLRWDRQEDERGRPPGCTIAVPGHPTVAELEAPDGMVASWRNMMRDADPERAARIQEIIDHNLAKARAYFGEEEPPADAPEPNVAIADRLRQVSEMHAAGLLTDEEYAAKRAELIRQL